MDHKRLGSGGRPSPVNLTTDPSRGGCRRAFRRGSSWLEGGVGGGCGCVKLAGSSGDFIADARLGDLASAGAIPLTEVPRVGALGWSRRTGAAGAANSDSSGSYSLTTHASGDTGQALGSGSRLLLARISARRRTLQKSSTAQSRVPPTAAFSKSWLTGTHAARQRPVAEKSLPPAARPPMLVESCTDHCMREEGREAPLPASSIGTVKALSISATQRSAS
mmetsp:Transcript_97270/g.208706  ORF Transcript_97270/g.208706 Transcript_97270/m.208706 type:complete len:221 (+) Transcript_97270:241-903(+)